MAEDLAFLANFLDGYVVPGTTAFVTPALTRSA